MYSPMVMALLRIGNYLIDSQCIVMAHIASSSSQVIIHLSCCADAFEGVSPCLVKTEEKLKKFDTELLTFVGEEAEALKLYFTNLQVGNSQRDSF